MPSHLKILRYEFLSFLKNILMEIFWLFSIFGCFSKFSIITEFLQTPFTISTHILTICTVTGLPPIIVIRCTVLPLTSNPAAMLAPISISSYPLQGYHSRYPPLILLHHSVFPFHWIITSASTHAVLLVILNFLCDILVFPTKPPFAPKLLGRTIGHASPRTLTFLTALKSEYP